MNIKVDMLADNSGYRIRVMNHSQTMIDLTVSDALNMLRTVNALITNAHYHLGAEREKVIAIAKAALESGAIKDGERWTV